MPRKNSVFINCPFDEKYKDMFRAMVFVVLDCKADPYCALKNDDSGHVRVNTILKMITFCGLGIHDILRTELDDVNKLPRFNMPFELGLFLGARYFGKRSDNKKATLVLDKEPYRYQKFISDIAGQDIHSHNNQPYEVIRIVRNWLQHALRGKGVLPGGKIIVGRFLRFQSELPALCEIARLDMQALTYRDYTWLVRTWLARNALA